MKEYNAWDFFNADSLIQSYSEAQSNCPVTYTYTFDEIKDLVSPMLTVTDIWKDHIFIWDIPSYKENKFVPDIPFKNIDPIYLKKMEKELGWHTMFIAKLSI
jgi:hypothetical protein